MDRLDADPAVLNTPGGIVDLRTGAVRPSDPAELCSQITAVAPADQEDCPAWKAALDLYMKSDSEMVTYLQRFAGYCLWGALVDQVVVFAHGKGGNGKGPNTVLRIAGPPECAVEVFLAHLRPPSHRARPALCPPRRLVGDRKGRRWNMTRGSARCPAATLSPPASCARTTSNTRRSSSSPCSPTTNPRSARSTRPRAGARTRFRPHRADQDRAAGPGFDTKSAEWPAILRWMINGCLDWRREGLNPPKKVVDASAEYPANQNNVAAWLADGCVEDAGVTTTLKDLFASWASWCEASGERTGTARALADSLEDQGFKRVRMAHGTRAHAGLRVATV